MNERPGPRVARWLCLCEAGTVRSATLAWVLREDHHQEAIAAGLRNLSSGALKDLCAWAKVQGDGRIIVVDPPLRFLVPLPWRSHLEVAQIGPDRWGQPLHPELVAVCRRAISFAFP